ncbi:hypothetical protein N7474_008841 [Penicillium riverlandense]|uniref:uncharacterized protein n=1 Tax=Penicillium riverlandense TaxID=1903569 RepID=UPI002547E84A|nr:uncharacterized protein N7474_008841 [Penicillium riverlandense]KAJ5812540.1 hypothetical protein N7474_008841 [Penicillium riverlandense]
MPRNKKAKGRPPHGPARQSGSGSATKGYKGPNASHAKTPPSQSQSQSQKGATPKTQQQHQNQRPIVPFLRRDRILLIGEGDFSFARSLATQYKCRNLCATCYDSKETLYGKYPQAESNINDIVTASRKITSSSTQNEEEQGGSNETPAQIQQKKGPKVLFGVDARKLGSPTGGGKDIRSGLFARKESKRPAWKPQDRKLPPSPGGPWDVICFNFPHVGGLSTDVNRQVRANQELLVAFFKSCVPLLSNAPESVDEEDYDFEEDEDDDGDGSSEREEEEDEQTSGLGVRTGPGQILVSLFEAEPYTLWNIKDLARHAGLQVVTSFKFPWTSYEGYSHARTVGEIEAKHHEGRGGWRGEDRNARMYVFEVKREEPKHPSKGGKKRARNDSDSDSD